MASKAAEASRGSVRGEWRVEQDCVGGTVVVPGETMQNHIITLAPRSANFATGDPGLTAP